MAQHNNTSLIKRVKRNTNFTNLSNEVFKAGLSPDALGVLCYILHLPDDWVIHKTQLQKVFNIGREKIDRIFKEIEKSGFLIPADMIRSGGKFIGRNYFFYDEPQPSGAKPLSENPSTANTQLLNTNIEVNTNNTNNPLPPLEGGEDYFDKDYSINLSSLLKMYPEYCMAYCGLKINSNLIDKKLVDKMFRHLYDYGYDASKVLVAIKNIGRNDWERSRNYPSLRIKTLLKPDTIMRYQNLGRATGALPSMDGIPF